MATRPEGRRISPVYIVLGVVLVLVLGYFLYSNFIASDEPLTAPVITPEPGAQPAPAEPEPTPTPAPDEIEVFEIFEGRDPFRPLVFESPGGDGGDGGGPLPEPTPTGAPNGATPEPTAPPPRSGVQVEVLSVAEDGSSATVRVGSQVFEDAQEGDTLSSGVAVVDIEDPCVDFQRNGRPFTLCEGEQVLK